LRLCGEGHRVADRVYLCLIERRDNGLRSMRRLDQIARRLD
jgi:hypothetical protein